MNAGHNPTNSTPALGSDSREPGSFELRSAPLALAIAALSISTQESNAQIPFYGSAVPAVGYSSVPVASYGTTCLNGSLYSTPVYGSTVYGNSGYWNVGYGTSPYINPSIAPGGRFSSINGSAYRPNHPYGTASTDLYWNTRSSGWNNGWNSNSWDNRWDSRRNDSWSSGCNDDRWRHDNHLQNGTRDRSRDDGFRHNRSSSLFSPVKP